MSMNIEMMKSEIDSRHYYARSMTKLTLCFTDKNGKGWK